MKAVQVFVFTRVQFTILMDQTKSFLKLLMRFSTIASISAITSAIGNFHVGMYVISRAIVSRIRRVLMNTIRTFAQSGVCISASMGIDAQVHVVNVRNMATHCAEFKLGIGVHAVMRVIANAIG